MIMNTIQLIKTYQTQSLLINNEVRTRFIAEVNKDMSFMKYNSQIARFPSSYVCYKIDGKFNISTQSRNNIHVRRGNFKIEY